MASISRTDSRRIVKPPFELRETWERGSLRLSVVGELDLASAPVLEERLGRLVPGLLSVVLDLSGLEFIDSTGIRVLIDAVDHASSHQYELEVVGDPSPQVKRVLALLHADGYILGDDASRT